MIADLETIPDIIKKERIDVGVVSYGGCASNTLAKFLESNKFRVRTPIWSKILCHCPEPVDSDIPFIYIYRDIEDAFLSQKKRGKGYWDVNQQKLSNNKNTPLSDKNLLELMKKQFLKWSNAAKTRDNILMLSYNEFFTPMGHLKINNFLGMELIGYPEFILH